MKDSAVQISSKKYHVVGLLLLLILVFSAISHSHEFKQDADHAFAQLDCKLCQQQVEPLKQSVRLAHVNVGYYLAVEPTFKVELLFNTRHNISWQRAPPSH